MAIINMIPSDGTVVIDGNVAVGVNFAGLDPEIHSISWYGSTGQLEFVFDPVTVTKRPNENFANLSAYQIYVDQAQAIINAQLNPIVYYATVDNYEWGVEVIPLGGEVIVSTPNTPQPPNTTNLEPPILQSYQSLFWNNTSWVASPVSPSITLSAAKTFLITETKVSGANHVSTQSRIYSPLQLATSVDPGALLCADYPSITLSDYQLTIDGRVTDLINLVNSASTLTDLYTFNPNVDPSPA